MFLFLKFIKNIEKLSAVRKVLETLLYRALGSFETLGSKLSHGTSKKFADVRTHLRKISGKILSSLYVICVSLFVPINQFSQH